jgi:hypothetical protein
LPDAGGLNTWTSFLAQGNRIEALKAGLLGSEEYFNLAGGTNNGFLGRVYNDILQRPIDHTGLAAWTAQLNMNVSRTSVALQIIQSQEGYSKLLSSSIPLMGTVVISGFYLRFLHLPSDPSGLANFVNLLLQNQITDQGVIQVMVSSIEYQDFIGRF